MEEWSGLEGQLKGFALIQQMLLFSLAQWEVKPSPWPHVPEQSQSCEGTHFLFPVVDEGCKQKTSCLAELSFPVRRRSGIQSPKAKAGNLPYYLGEVEEAMIVFFYFLGFFTGTSGSLRQIKRGLLSLEYLDMEVVAYRVPSALAKLNSSCQI